MIPEIFVIKKCLQIFLDVLLLKGLMKICVLTLLVSESSFWTLSSFPYSCGRVRLVNFRLKVHVNQLVLTRDNDDKV